MTSWRTYAAGLRATVAAMTALRWRLLRGAVRHGGAEQVGAVVSLVASALVGVGVGLSAAVVGRTHAHADDLAVIFCCVVVLALVGFGIVAGVTQPVDPRTIAAEPLTDTERSVGVLATAAFGPPGLAGIVIAFGLAIGMARGALSYALVIPAAAAWAFSLLLIARTATNLLALLISRAARLGQLAAGSFALVFYGAFQFVPAAIGSLDDAARARLAGWLAWSPPGQIGRSLGDAGDAPLAALAHLAAGSAWLPVLAFTYLSTSVRLARSVRQRSGAVRPLSAVALLVRRWCGDGIVGAIAWRSILTRFRTPRTALETFTGAGVGLAAVLVPTLARDAAGSGAVLVGGAVQLAVLFMSGNSLGTDGPAVTHELLAGAALGDVVRGKARSIAIVASPLAVIGPVLAAAITGEWRFFVAGLGVGAGSLLAGAGAAIVQSALVPIAIPESDNPFASGESGKGIVAALLLFVVLGALAVFTVPVALALLWATDRGRTWTVTALGIVTVAIGWAVFRLGVRIATARLGDRQPEFVLAVTPAR